MPLFQNEFDLYENKPVGRTHFHKNGFARTFNTEEKGSPKMAYCLRLQENEKKKNEREIWSTTADLPQVHRSIQGIKS